MSGTNFFTLGLGDVTPTTTSARVLTTVEAGMGFGFLALVIGYLPVLSQAFSRRESAIALLDARAGSPPTAAELLRRRGGRRPSPGRLLNDWERWSAEVLESHISFPVLAFYRSQHDNQSWVAALTTVLDTCALVITGVDGAGAGGAPHVRHGAARSGGSDECPRPQAASAVRTGFPTRARSPAPRPRRDRVT